VGVASLFWVLAAPAHAIGMGPPGGGGGDPISGIAASLPSTEGLTTMLVAALVVVACAWRLHRRGLWLAVAAVALLWSLPSWAALSVWLVLFAALRAGPRPQLMPAFTTGALVALSFVVGADALAPSVAAVVDVLLGMIAVVPVERSATVLTGPSGYVHVADACVGLEGVVVAFALSSAVALCAGARQRAAMLAGALHASAWAGLNVIRIAALFVLVQSDLDAAVLAHDAAGLALMAAQLGLCATTWLVVRSVHRRRVTHARTLMPTSVSALIRRKSDPSVNGFRFTGNEPPGRALRPRNA
jgi:exosortase/archaeosortase family protein